MYLTISFVGAAVLEEIARVLHVKPINLGRAVTIVFLPLLFPIVVIALLIIAIVNTFKRKDNEIK
jgi:predicted MFS family arabinose efflux permease